MTVFRLAWRNLGRNKKRTLMALMAIALAQFCVLVVDGFMAGYGDSMRNMMTGPMLGHFQVHTPKYRAERSMDLTINNVSEKLAALKSLDDVSNAMPRLYGPALAAKTQEGFMAIVVGVDEKAENGDGGFFEPGTMKLEEGSKSLAIVGKEEKIPALVGAILAQRQQLKLGDELAIIGQTSDGSMATELVVVSGVMRTNIDLVNRMGVMIDLAHAQEIFDMPNRVHEITVRGENPEEAAELSKRVALLPEFTKLEVLPWEKLAPEMVEMMKMQDSSTLLILILVFLAAAAGVANTMLMSTFERTREMGMLLALGTSPKRVIGILLTETVLLGVLGIFVGTVFGTAVTWGVGLEGIDLASLGGGEDMKDLSFQGMTFDLRIFPRLRVAAIFQGLLAMGFTCTLAAIWPASYVSSLEPTEAMRR